MIYDSIIYLFSNVINISERLEFFYIKFIFFFKIKNDFKIERIIDL